MSASAANLQHKRLSSETEHTQRASEMDMSREMKLRERQRFFFEEVFQHDVDVYLSNSHLQIDYKRPPIGSISSMEVNVDMLEQLELLDLSDQDALDVFFSASGDDGGLTSPLPDQEDDEPGEGITLLVPSSSSIKSRMSSTSSAASYDSQGTNGEGTETPTIQSEDEDGHSDDLLLTPTRMDEKNAPPLFSP